MQENESLLQPRPASYPTPPDAEGYFFENEYDYQHQIKSTQDKDGRVTKTNPIYPTLQDAEGYYYEDENLETLKIMTKVHDNGNKILKVLLPDGKIAIVRELSGAEGLKAQKQSKNEEERTQVAYASMACKINGESYNTDELLMLKAKVLNRIIMASNLLNF